MKRTILFLVILILVSSTVSAIYQEPPKLKPLPSRNIIIKQVMMNDGIMREFTGGLIVNVPRKAWSREGTEETTPDSRYATSYERRTKFQSTLEFGTHAHDASTTSQADITRKSIYEKNKLHKDSIFRRIAPPIITTKAVYKGPESDPAKEPLLDPYPPLMPGDTRPYVDESGFTRDYLYAEEQTTKAQHRRIGTGAVVYRGPESTPQDSPVYESKYPPLMPGDTRPYVDESGFTRDYFAVQEAQKTERPYKRGTGLMIIEQSPKGANPYFFGGAGQMQTAGQAYARGQTPITEKSNPYLFGGAGVEATAGQAAEIDEILKQRQERARMLLARMGR
jgi:hypothetical protein